MKRPSWQATIFVLLTAGLFLMVFSLNPAQAKAKAKKAKAAPSAVAAKTEAAAAEEAEEGREVLHMVRRGEELHMLAGYYYSDCRQWPKIYRENRQLLKNPNLIYPGEILTIAVPDDWQPYMSYDEFFQKATIGRTWVTASSSPQAAEAKSGEEEKPQPEAPPAKAPKAKAAAPAKQKGQ